MSNLCERFVDRKLQSIAENRYEECKERFLSEQHFLDCMIICYNIVAEKFCREWINKRTAGIHLTQSTVSNIIRSVKLCNIPREMFADALERFRKNGRLIRPPYRACLDSLVADRIVHCSDAYSNAEGHSYSKAYGLHNDFALEAVGNYLASMMSSESFDIRSAILARPPAMLIDSLIRKAKRIYQDLGDINGVRLVLPNGWEKVDGNGHLLCNPDISISRLLEDMQLFKDQKDYGDKYGRHYDWFTSCSSAFRSYLFVGDKQFYEILDCPSGVFWMLALAGFREGKISRPEASRLIFHCLRGTFYSDISGEEKTPALKVVFMKIINSTPKQHRKLDDQLSKTIIANLSTNYPGFWTYVQAKQKTSENVGRDVHAVTTHIERIIMNDIVSLLRSNGCSQLHRVHDAIWGVDDVPNPPEYLYGVVFNHFVESEPIDISTFL